MMIKKEDITAIINPNQSLKDPGLFKDDDLELVRKCHRSIRNYKPTPLHDLKALAHKLGVKQVLIKDESYRFDLKAFKALGVTYALFRKICHLLDLNDKTTTFEDLKKDIYQETLSKITWVTATDGNHGKGLAWAAKTLGCKAVIFMPHGSTQERLQAIIAEGAQASITNFNYDETVAYAGKLAKENQWILVQDTALEDYTQMPKWIMQGYTTMAAEVEDALQHMGPKQISHIFLQAGVGSMAASMIAYFFKNRGETCPKFIILEPHEANCFYKSAEFADGLTHDVTGHLETIMAGLSCGVANPIAWPTIRNICHAYLSCSDQISRQGTILLARPEGHDPRVVSGESGSVGIGALEYIMTSSDKNNLKELLKLDEKSVALFFNTEGDTDTKSYKEIIGAEINQKK